QGELGDDEEPLILVNGERMDSLEDIGGFPVEALRNVKVLPRGSAVRAGGRSGQRVVSLTLQRKMRAATLTAAPKVATAGDWHAGRGEALLTYVQGVTRANVALRVRGESSLLESERDILQPDQSAANHENFADLGDFRTLRPNVRNYDLNGSFNTRLAPWLTGNATMRLNRNVSRSLRGLPSAFFILPATNPASPFPTDMTLAFLGQDPLRSRAVRNSADGRLTLNGRFGLWTSNFSARYGDSSDRYGSDRVAAFGAIPLGNSIDPFTADLSDLIEIRRDTSRSHTVNKITQLSFTGPAFTLPAGPVQTTIEGRLSWYSLHASSTFSIGPDRRFRRNEQAIRGAVDVPLTSRDSDVLAALGNISATAEYGRIHYSDAGSLDYYSIGAAWEPIPPLQLRASVEHRERPASMQILGDPVVEYPLVRVFDPLTGETVDVTQLNGGNPDILPERATVRRLNAVARLMPRLNLQLNAEYTDTNARNYISSLPPASLPVMLAFPERFVRDTDGNLVRVDFRPVNFDSHREKRLRWGLSMRTKLRSGNILSPPPADAGPSEPESGDEAAAPAPVAAEAPTRRGSPATYLQLTANHSVVFSDKITIRPELDTVDLLGGGALGIGGGRLRHQIDATAAVTSGGLGARAGFGWRGPSTLDTRIGGVSDTLHFSPVFLMNLRLFADAGRF
ncbi:MAG TPA: hypothetical protein VHN55_03455, partial [Sphingomicrobium sp.]|nr:hypothetical protein [Sphingomicrobium sp.]